MASDWNSDSRWFKLPKKMVAYSEENLAKWSDRELLIMHWHMTRRLDGYGVLFLDNSLS